MVVRFLLPFNLQEIYRDTIENLLVMQDKFLIIHQGDKTNSIYWFYLIEILQVIWKPESLGLSIKSNAIWGADIS